MIESDLTDEFSNRHLIALPALIDPHVHFRTPGAEHKEDWITGAQAAAAGGYDTVIDMPNNTPPAVDCASVVAKKKIIEKQIRESGTSLRYYLHIGATPDNAAEIVKARAEVVGIKLFMGSSTGNLLVDKYEDQARIFELAAKLNLPLAVHAENEETIKININRPHPNPPLKKGGENNPPLFKEGVGGGQFDLIILDPPAFIKDRHKIKEGVFGYRKINEAALRILPSAGILVSASCSQHLSLVDFRYMLSESAGHSGRILQILETFTHGLDHPELAAFTEGEYLKCVFARVL